MTTKTTTPETEEQAPADDLMDFMDSVLEAQIEQLSRWFEPVEEES